MKTSCCKDCQDRVPPSKETKGCRATCEKWKEYEKNYNKKMAERSERFDKDEWKSYYTDKRIQNCKKYKVNEYGK